MWSATPTKHGPWSSLPSAVREHFDWIRSSGSPAWIGETSGVVLIERRAEAAARLRVQGRRKVPAAIEFPRGRATWRFGGEPMGQLQSTAAEKRPETGEFRNRQHVSEKGQRAVTH